MSDPAQPVLSTPQAPSESIWGSGVASGRIKFPTGRLPQTDRRYTGGVSSAVALHVLFIIALVVTPQILAHRAMGDEGKPGGGGGGGGGRDIQFINLRAPASASRAPREVAVRSPAPVPRPDPDVDELALPVPSVNDENIVQKLATVPVTGEITLENVRDALLYDRYEVDVPEPTRTRARASIERMLEIG